MSQPKVLSEAFGKPLKAAGFKKRKRDTWYLENDETILVLNLQKSSYGPQYYVNLALWLKPLGEADSPPSHRCHIGCRWEDVMTGENKLPEQLLNLDVSYFSDAMRISEIGRLLEEHILPFFSKVSSLANLRLLYHANELPKNCVYRQAQEFLGRK